MSDRVSASPLGLVEGSGPTGSGVRRAQRISLTAILRHWSQRVAKRIGRPVDRWAVAAALESEGLRDVDVRERYRLRDVFSLASLLHGKMSPARTSRPRGAVVPESHVGRALRLAHSVAAGSLFALPLLGQSACVLLTRHSLWASLDFTQVQATAAGLGTLTSFVVTGAATMAIGRQGSVYRAAGELGLLRKVCARLVGAGVALLLAVALVLALAHALLFPLVDGAVFAAAAGYFVAHGVLMISLAVLFVLGLHGRSFVLTVAGALLVAALVRVGHVRLQVAQIGAITLTALGALATGFRALARLDRAAPGDPDATLPPADVVAGTLLPYALYGVGYFLLLFMDRALVWSAPAGNVPLGIWFNAAHEIGLDWALVSLVAPVGYVEFAVREFSLRVARDQAQTPVTAVREHRARIAGFVTRAFRTLAGVSVASVAATYLGVRAFHRLDAVASSRVTVRVFWPAAVGYQLLAWALLGALLLFTLGRGPKVVRAVWRALAAGAWVGIVASRVLAPEWAVLGFVTAAALFAAQMAVAVRALVRRPDYFHYAAF
jgi:hypothetical protein